MTQSNQSKNEDVYREPISDFDLEGKPFDFLNSSEKEEALPIPKEIFEESVGENAGIKVDDFAAQETSIKESIAIEQENFEEKKLDNVNEFQDIPKKEDMAKVRQEENIPVNLIKEEVKIEENPLEKKIQIIEEVAEGNISQNIVEEVKKEETYKEIRDEIWGKANPLNQDRFKDSGLDKTGENKSLLDDISVKITLLDDDIEDSLIENEEALQKIKEIREKLNSLTN